MKLQTLGEIKKTLGALGVMVPTAVGFGLIDSATAGLVMGGITVATAGVVYLLNNEKKGS